MPFVGFDGSAIENQRSVEKNIFGQGNTEDTRAVGNSWSEYTLPMLVNHTRRDIYGTGIYVSTDCGREFRVSKLRWPYGNTIRNIGLFRSIS